MGASTSSASLYTTPLFWERFWRTSGIQFVALFIVACLVNVVLTSFPRAMLVMAGTFGLWRARIISNRLFAAGVTIVVLVLLGGTAWMSNGFWTPNGAYSRYVSPILFLLWIVVASRILLARGPATRPEW